MSACHNGLRQGRSCCPDKVERPGRSPLRVSLLLQVKNGGSSAVGLGPGIRHIEPSPLTGSLIMGPPWRASRALRVPSSRAAGLAGLTGPQPDPNLLNRLRGQPLVIAMSHDNLLDTVDQ